MYQKHYYNMAITTWLLQHGNYSTSITTRQSQHGYHNMAFATRQSQHDYPNTAITTRQSQHDYHNTAFTTRLSQHGYLHRDNAASSLFNIAISHLHPDYVFQTFLHIFSVLPLPFPLLFLSVRLFISVSVLCCLFVLHFAFLSLVSSIYLLSLCFSSLSFFFLLSHYSLPFFHFYSSLSL